MITKEEILSVGKTGKPHGIKGELAFYFSSHHVIQEETPYYIFEIDGLFVPFFVESYRSRGSLTALIKLDGIDSDAIARSLSNQTIYIHQEFVTIYEDDASNSNGLIGFTVHDNKVGKLGEIIEIDESTSNTLFVVKYKNTSLLIPATDDFIERMDKEKKEIHMQLPEGLTDLDAAEEV